MTGWRSRRSRMIRHSRAGSIAGVSRRVRTTWVANSSLSSSCMTVWRSERSMALRDRVELLGSIEWDAGHRLGLDLDRLARELGQGMRDPSGHVRRPGGADVLEPE